MLQTLFLTKVEQAAFQSVVSACGQAQAALQAAQRAAEEIVGEITATHKAPALKPGETVRGALVEGRPALVYESADPKPEVATPAPNRVAEALAAVANDGGNGDVNKE